MKTFTYTKITSSHGDEEYGYEFDYTVRVGFDKVQGQSKKLWYVEFWR